MTDRDGLTIDEHGPLSWALPQSVEELGTLVKQAKADGLALYPIGGRTQLHVGLPPTKNGFAVEMGALQQVQDYPARDMTITVGAGIPVAELQSKLASENQRLPIDVPQADKATLGGILATNTSGPKRYAMGTLRDYLIGIQFVNDEGEAVKAGGRVVKNVAGYDLCKLHIGALGTLGIITEVTLKLRPLPEARTLLVVGCQGDELSALLNLIHSSQTRPTILDVLDRRASQHLSELCNRPLPETPWNILVGYEESEQAVAWQASRLTEELRDASHTKLVAHQGEAGLPIWQTLCEMVDVQDALLTLKANVLSSSVTSCCQFFEGLSENLLVHCHAGSGIVRVSMLEGVSEVRAREILEQFSGTLKAESENVVLPRCPTEWKSTFPVWGKPRGDWALMKRVKEQFDPRGLFNPGRFVDGI